MLEEEELSRRLYIHSPLRRMVFCWLAENTMKYWCRRKRSIHRDRSIVPISWIRGSVKKTFCGMLTVVCQSWYNTHSLVILGLAKVKNFDILSDFPLTFPTGVQQLVSFEGNQTSWNPFRLRLFPCLVEARWLGREWGMPDRRWTWRSKKVSFPLRWTQAYTRAAPLFDQAAFSWSCKYGGKIFEDSIVKSYVP